MSATVQDSIQKELVQHQRDILMRVQETMEFGEGEYEVEDVPRLLLQSDPVHRRPPPLDTVAADVVQRPLDLVQHQPPSEAGTDGTSQATPRCVQGKDPADSFQELTPAERGPAPAGNAGNDDANNDLSF